MSEPPEPQQKAAYDRLSAVEIYAPWAGLEERGHRQAIYTARDLAQVRALRSKHSKSRTLYWIAAQFAGEWVFKRAPLDDLVEIREMLSWFFMSARRIERLEDPDLE